MAQALSAAAGVLRAAGLAVVEMNGWADRGETDGGFTPRGIILHHDAMGLGWNDNPNDDSNVPQYMSQDGNNGAQFWVARTGTWWLMAAGRKWHAGTGQWRSIPTDAGNTFTAGVETDHTTGNPWEPAQFDSINRGCRALVQHYSWDVDEYCCGHREYAPTRKIDPESFDLDAWRAYLKTATTPTGTEDDMSAADVAAINAHIDLVLKHINDELDHIRNFIDGNPIKPSGFDDNGAAHRAQDTLAKVNHLMTKFS